MTKYCGLQFAATTTFCPNCGRPTESRFSIRPLQEQESEVACLRRELQEKDELIRQLFLTRTQRDDTSRVAARRADWRASYGCEGNRKSAQLLPSAGH